LTIKAANIHFNEQGTPYADDFADLYFSDAQGLAETQYVFLRNNALPQRWIDWPQQEFVIAETGFGTGLNFLATLVEFAAFCEQKNDDHFNLHYISTEKFPLQKADLQTALAHFPELTSYSEALLLQYPMAIPGCHRLTFLQGRVTLDLWLGDVHQILPQLVCSASGLVDAWYLDGFAPNKNPDMWSDKLFKQMARLAKVNCTFATFTAAGKVKRGLRCAGFTVEKQPGHGRKRDMLAGHLDIKAASSTPTSSVSKPYFLRSSAIKNAKAQTVAVIGGGLAGANCAYALAKRGYKVQVYCKEEALAQGASGNPQGGFYPQLNAEASIASQIQALSFTYAAALYRQVLSEGNHFSHQWCGVLQVAFNDKVQQRYQKLVDNQQWPEELIHWLSSASAEQTAQVPMPYPGLFIPQGGWINPPQLVEALFNGAAHMSDCQIQTGKGLKKLVRIEDVWQLDWQDDSSSFADIVVFATGSESVDIPYLSGLPFRLIRGQVEAIRSQQGLNNLATVLCHKGYLCPEFEGQHALGSTYVKDQRSLDYRLDEQAANILMNQKALRHCDWAQQIVGAGKGRAAIRCSSPDHLPLVGAVPNIALQKQQYWDLYKALPNTHYPVADDIPNLFMLCGLGSRGLSTAPLLAEVLASQIARQSLPLGENLLKALSPNRFLIRDLIRRV
jgi:tRNA 5-methylaminomethyl-2-thiouridine biosynthesis bifunctional protein